MTLQEECLQYVVRNPDVIFVEVESYAAISEELKDTLREYLIANDPQ